MTSELAKDLRDLQFLGVSNALDDFLHHATKKRLGPLQVLEKLVEVETAERMRRSLKRRERNAKIGHIVPFADFDWEWPTEIDRPAVERALRGQFIHEGANVIIDAQRTRKYRLPNAPRNTAQILQPHASFVH